MKLIVLLFLGFLLMFSASCVDSPTDSGNGGDTTHREWIVTENSLTDPDGNVYTTVQIGAQLWTVENLRTSKYADGTPIPRVTNNDEWQDLSTPAYCMYDNYDDHYGYLYNWYVVNPSNPQNIAPQGWRVSSDTDWDVLRNHLGGPKTAGAKVKTTGTDDWQAPNTGATNKSGFSALPGGYRSPFGSFRKESLEAFWWSAVEANTGGAFGFSVTYDSEVLYRVTTTKLLGASLRLIRDDD